MMEAKSLRTPIHLRYSLRPLPPFMKTSIFAQI